MLNKYFLGNDYVPSTDHSVIDKRIWFLPSWSLHSCEKDSKDINTQLVIIISLLLIIINAKKEKNWIP